MKYAKLPKIIQKNSIIYFLERKESEIRKKDKLIKICHSFYANKSEKFIKIPIAKTNNGFVSLDSFGYTKEEADKNLLFLLNTMGKIEYESEIEYMKDIYKNKNLPL